MYTIESKNQLARLMATENLIIEHQKISTAKFDPMNRILYLPIWQNMTGFIYDLLTGHEVGHALYTPPQGWHDAVVDKSKPKSYKHFLNVVEDARIEKRIQRKYPGLRLSFKQAYEELFNRDFFGIRHRDINKLSFIDRLNIYTKSQYTKDIRFNDEEIGFINEVKNVESWEQVIEITDKIFAYSKHEQFEMQQNDFAYSFSDSEQNQDDQSMGDPDEYEYEYEEIEENIESDEKSEEKIEEESDEESEKDSSGVKSEEDIGEGSDEESDEESDSEKTDEETEKNILNRDKETQESQEDQFDPKCETDENYRQNEKQLLDATCKEYLYLNFPKPNLEDIITPWKRVHEQMDIHWFGLINQVNPYSGVSYLTKEKINELVNKFKSKNEKYISLLVKEFEMRKAAKSFAKNKISVTGDLDINKLANYRIDENIFRRIMTMPNGKKHGLILLLDYSGSMSDKMEGSIEQILVLSMFCRKVNIPFRVYAFGYDTMTVKLDKKLYNQSGTVPFSAFSSNDKDLVVSPIQLREYLNNEMTKAEFTNCFKNMILLKESYACSAYTSTNMIERPKSERLTNTPLSEAVIAITQVMKEFKKTNNLDITNLVVVHDGDADGIKQYKEGFPYTNFSCYTSNVIICDKKNKFQFKINDVQSSKTNDILIAALKYCKFINNCNIIGFFIMESSRYKIRNAMYRRYEFQNTEQTVNGFDPEILIDKLKKDKYIESYNTGYDSFYMVQENDIKIEDDEFDVDENASQRKLVTAFMKFNKKRQVNRVLVNKFIQRIAA